MAGVVYEPPVPSTEPPLGWLYQRYKPVEPEAVSVALCPQVAAELKAAGVGH